MPWKVRRYSNIGVRHCHACIGCISSRHLQSLLSPILLQWFCTRGINRPTYLNPGLLGIEPTADYAVQPWLPSGIVLASVAFAAYLVASKLAKLGNPRSIIRGDEVIGSLH